MYDDVFRPCILPYNIMTFGLLLDKENIHNSISVQSNVSIVENR